MIRLPSKLQLFFLLYQIKTIKLPVTLQLGVYIERIIRIITVPNCLFKIHLIAYSPLNINFGFYISHYHTISFTIFQTKIINGTRTCSSILCAFIRCFNTFMAAYVFLHLMSHTL